MDDPAEHGIWSRLARLFSRDNDEKLEQAIIDASEEGEVEADEKSMLLSLFPVRSHQIWMSEKNASSVASARTLVPSGLSRR